MSWLWKLKEKVAIALGKFLFQALQFIFWNQGFKFKFNVVNLSQFVCIIVQLTQVKQLYSWKHILPSSWNLIRNQLRLHSWKLILES
jgi:hypothetical protein